MKSIQRITTIVTGLILSLTSCNAQPEQTIASSKDRMPAVSGSFYPASKSELTQMLAESFNITHKIVDAPLAIIVPHAGYVFSGSVAASGFRQIDRNSKFDHVFIIGSSHTMYFNGASIYDQGDFITPFGKVRVDTLSGWLVDEYKVFNNDPKPHTKEHSLEVQLPFLQYWLNEEFSIVPIIIGGESKETCKKIAQALKPFFNKNNLFVISSDFSHYPDYEHAQQCDKALADAIVKNSAEDFLKMKTILESKNIRNLATAMCGWTSVYTLLRITETDNDIKYQNIKYQNSGDTPYGDKDRVVGYYSIGVYKEKGGNTESSYNLSDEDKIALLKIARNTIQSYIPDKKQIGLKTEELPVSLSVPAGAFVTLKQKDNLRGCIGHFEADNPLFVIVQKMAIAAATEDPRFYPVKEQEIAGLEIEISVLTPMKKINDIDEIELGKHGIYIKQGHRAGTFLPQVATDTGWNKEQFLGHCARDKAGIGWDGWKTADIYIYEALVFGEQEFNL
jgi:AmmeMemoRadiSam system protein B/AmmeMemoRadiSam system protein A